MLIAVGSDKGSPGATTLSIALGLVWPGDRVVVELDPRGADLPYRLMAADGQPLESTPSVVDLAVDVRSGAVRLCLDRYAQPTLLGVPVIAGELSARANGRLAAHMPAIGAACAAWHGTVIADLGSLHPSNTARVVAKSAAAVLLVVRPTVEGLGHLRDRVEDLTEFLGDPCRIDTPVGVVVVAEPRDTRAACERTGTLLASTGSPARVVGQFADDQAGADALWTAQRFTARSARSLFKSHLVRSAGALATTLWTSHAAAIDHSEEGASATSAAEACGAVPGGPR